VVKLTELTQYAFRICASNDAGFGPYSDVYYFTTSKASPPAIRGAHSWLIVRLEQCHITYSRCECSSDIPETAEIF